MAATVATTTMLFSPPVVVRSVMKETDPTLPHIGSDDNLDEGLAVDEIEPEELADPHVEVACRVICGMVGGSGCSDSVVAIV